MTNGLLLKGLIAVAALAWAGALVADGKAVPSSFFAPMSTVTGIVAFTLVVFEKVLWRVPGMSLLVHRPDLRGTWKGTVRSSWVGPDGLPQPERDVFVTIAQTYSTLHVRLFSDESSSEPLVASVLRHPDDTYDVALVYRNSPKVAVRERSEISVGGALLRVGGEKEEKLEGQYWTDRLTRGDMSVVRFTRTRARDLTTARALAAAAAAKSTGGA